MIVQQTSVHSCTAGNPSAELHTPEIGGTLFFLHKWTERTGILCQCSVLSLRQENLMFFIDLFYWFSKTPENRHSNKLEPGINWGTMLAVRNGIRLQDFSHMKAIDFSWKSWTSFREEGERVLFEKKWWYEAGCVYKLKDFWDEQEQNTEQQICQGHHNKTTSYSDSCLMKKKKKDEHQFKYIFFDIV